MNDCVRQHGLHVVAGFETAIDLGGKASAMQDVAEVVMAIG